MYLKGHSGDLRGLANVHISDLDADVITASTDGSLCVWKSETKTPVLRSCWKVCSVCTGYCNYLIFAIIIIVSYHHHPKQSYSVLLITFNRMFDFLICV